MKTVTILLAALMALFVVSGTVSAAEMRHAENTNFCGATQATPSVTTKSGMACEVQNIEGKVDSITPPNPAATDKRTMITVIDDKGKTTVVAVTSNTTLCGADMNPITLDAIKEGASVKVKALCAKEGEGIAQSITLVQ